MINSVCSSFEITQRDVEIEEFEKKLTIKIEAMLQNDFPRLVNTLYRLDVSEEKLKSQLANSPAGHAAETISKLIIERQLQKLQTRGQQSNNENIPDEEKW